MNKDKQIKIHFMYVVIILTLVIIATLASIFFANDSAWLFLSFAGTAVSIVLSIIAILITLIDVAGQRQQVADIAESAKILKETADRQAENYNNLDEIVETTINKVMPEQLSEYKEDIRAIFNESIDNLDLNGANKDELRMEIDRFFKDYNNPPTKGTISVGRAVKAFILEKSISEKDFIGMATKIDYHLYTLSKPKTLKDNVIVLRTKADVETSKQKDKFEIKKIENYLKEHGYL